MARRESTTTATLEDQAATDAELGLEELPTFEDLPESREAHLADLDARDDALNANGHANAHGVRPSEQCGVVAGHGPYPGSRCTYAEHPMDQPHSWEVQRDPEAEPPGHVYDDAEQPTLPGTPEPEQNEYTIPLESHFKGNDFQAAPGLESIGERLIEETNEFAPLRGIAIRYFWKRRGGKRGGAERFHALTKPSGLAAYSLGRPEFVLWLAADHCREAKLTEQQIEALVFDRLCQAQPNPDDHSAFRVVAPDFEGNILTVRKYGLEIFKDLRELGANAKQLSLLDRIELPPESDVEDAGEDGGDEE